MLTNTTATTLFAISATVLADAAPRTLCTDCGHARRFVESISPLARTMVLTDSLQGVQGMECNQAFCPACTPPEIYGLKVSVHGQSVQMFCEFIGNVERALHLTALQFLPSTSSVGTRTLPRRCVLLFQDLYVLRVPTLPTHQCGE